MLKLTVCYAVDERNVEAYSDLDFDFDNAFLTFFHILYCILYIVTICIINIKTYTINVISVQTGMLSDSRDSGGSGKLPVTLAWTRARQTHINPLSQVVSPVTFIFSHYLHNITYKYLCHNIGVEAYLSLSRFIVRRPQQ